MATTEKQRLMRKVQAEGFALVEANLYLDSHPTCRDGLNYFAKHKEEYEKAVAEYQEKFGPITPDGSDNTRRWEWATTPFPWERSED